MHLRPSMFSALRYSNYRFYWLALVLTVTGRIINTTALPWLVFELTGSPLMLGATGLAQSTPAIAFSFHGGAVADRGNRRQILFWTQGLNALLAIVLTAVIVAGAARVWHALLFAFLLGCVRAFDQPSRQALLGRVVPKEDMASGVALGNAVWQFLHLAAPGLAGLLIYFSGVGGTFALSCLLYLAASFFLAFVTVVDAVMEESKGGLSRDIFDGLRFIWQSEFFFTLIGISFFVSLFGMSYITLMPVFAQDILNVGARGYGFLHGSMGAGAVFGGLAVAYLGHGWRRGRQALGGALAFGGLLIAFAFSPWFALSMVLLFLAGFTNQFFITNVVTLLQLQLPDEMRGRVMGFFSLMWTLIPLGGAVGGAIAEFSGAPVAVALGGLLVSAMTLAISYTKPTVRDLA